MTKDRRQQDLLFKPLIVAGLVIVTFSLACLWIANMTLPQEESEGFRIIGYRFLGRWDNIDCHRLCFEALLLSLQLWQILLESASV